MQNPRRRAGHGIWMLASYVFGVIGIKNIPPVTLAVVGLHSAIYLRLFQLPWYKASQVCVSSYFVLYKRDYKRLLYAAFEHGDDVHLYYNMVSFILKGKTLERRFGSVKFLYLLLVFTLLTSTVLVALSRLASDYIDVEFDTTCAIGFSGVIFALKVLTSYYNANYSHQFLGIPILIPAKYAVWVELVLIQLMAPNVSFLGHLAGILVGLAYIKSPLGYLLDSIYALFSGPSIPQFQPRAEPSGYYRQPEFHEHSASGIHNAGREQVYPPFEEPDLETIRRRRLDRYQ